MPDLNVALIRVGQQWCFCIHHLLTKVNLHLWVGASNSTVNLCGALPQKSFFPVSPL